MARKTSVARTVTAGCYGCAATWNAANGQGAAAAHHDKTGHATWARVDMFVQYGVDSGEDARLAAALREAAPDLVARHIAESPLMKMSDDALRAARASMRLRPPRKASR